MQHQGDYNSSTAPYYYPPNPNPNPTTDFHHHQPPPYPSASPFTAAYHPQPPPPPPPSADYYPPCHPTDPISPTAPPSNPNNNNNLAYDHNNNNNINSSYDHHLNFPPPPPQKWILGKMLKLSHASTFQYNPNPVPVYDTNYGRSVSDLGGGGDCCGKKHDDLGTSSGGYGDGDTCSKSSTWKVFDDDFGKAVPKLDVKEGGVQEFRVKWLAENGGQSTMDVLCQIGLDGIRMLDPSTSTLRIYPLDTITRCEVYDSSTFAFWSKSTVDIEPRRIRLQSNSYTTNTLLDTLTVATIQVKEMGGRSRPVDTVKVTEQSTEKKKALGDGMNIIEPPNEEKYHWVPYEAVTKCSGCGGDFSAFNRKHHCRSCGDIFCDKCTHGIIALTSEDNAPQVRGDIKCRCDNVRRHNHNRLRFAQGQSKSAAKRRARHLGRCVKCGNFSHDGACPENQDNEFLKLCFDGPIRCYGERLLHPRGYAHARMISELDRLTEKKAKRFGLNV